MTRTPFVTTGGLAAIALIAASMTSGTIAGQATQDRPAQPAAAPAAAPQGRGVPPGPVVLSPEVQPDRRVTFRLSRRRPRTCRCAARTSRGTRAAPR